MSAQAQVIAFPSRRRGGEQWEPWLTEAAVARHYGVSTRTVRRWREQGMPSQTLGRAGTTRRFRLSAVEAWHAKGDAS